MAHDLALSSPAQPRIAALLRTLVARGVDTTLWTEHDPGEWVAEVARSGRLALRVVKDPVHRAYRWLHSGSVATATTTPAGQGGRRIGLVQGLWNCGRRIQNSLLFPDPQRLWAQRVQRRLLAELRSGDVVLTCSRPESAALVGAAAQRRGARWWLDFADGWCFQGLRPDAMADGPRRQRELGLERRLVAGADLVSTVNGELAAYFAALRPHRDVAVYPNIVPDEIADLPSPEPRDEAMSVPTLGYFGRLSLSDPERNLQPLLRLLRAEAARPTPMRARFRFLGVFSPRDRQEIAELEQLGHDVAVEAPRTREQLAAMRLAFDATLLLGSPHQRGTSSKLLDTLGLGLPVLAFVPVPSAAHALIAETGCGEVFELAAEPDCTRWRRFLQGVLGAQYGVEPSVRARYTGSSVLPGFMKRIAPWFEAPTNPR